MKGYRKRSLILECGSPETLGDRNGRAASPTEGQILWNASFKDPRGALLRAPLTTQHRAEVSTMNRASYPHKLH